MDIIFQGKLDEKEAAESLANVIRMFKDKYHIEQFREIHLSLTLVDQRGDDVELVDSETDKAYRTFEVYRESNDLTRRAKRPMLKLVIDNTQ